MLKSLKVYFKYMSIRNIKTKKKKGRKENEDASQSPGKSCPYFRKCNEARWEGLLTEAQKTKEYLLRESRLG